MSADSKNSAKKWSFHLWLMQRKPHPPAKFSKEHTKSTEFVSKISEPFVIFVVRISFVMCCVHEE